MSQRFDEARGSSQMVALFYWLFWISLESVLHLMCCKKQYVSIRSLWSLYHDGIHCFLSWLESCHYCGIEKPFLIWTLNFSFCVITTFILNTFWLCLPARKRWHLLETVSRKQLSHSLNNMKQKAEFTIARLLHPSLQSESLAG